MNQEEFFVYALDEYHRELRESDGIFGRAPLIVTSNVVLCGVVSYLLRPDLLLTMINAGGDRAESAYRVLAAVAIVFLVSSFIALALALRPRQYARLKTASHWSAWREAYAQTVRNSSKVYTDQRVDEIADSVRRRAMQTQILSLTKDNRGMNGRRHWWLNNAIALTIGSLLPILLLGLSAIWK